MNGAGFAIGIINILIKILFYILFYMAMLYVSGFLLDGNLPEVGSKVFISVGCATLCTFIPSFDGMKTFLSIRSK